MVDILIPGSEFEYIDQSEAPSIATNNPTVPLMMLAISSDKGPEDMRIVKGEEYYKLYGSEISFAKHGQPLIQAANAINNDGTLLIKRVVAEDATLGNLAIIAKVKQINEQKTNAAGQPLYLDSVNGTETIDSTAGNTPIMIDKAEITYEVKSVQDAMHIDTVETAIEAELDETGSTGTFTYPLYVIADNGRGVSKKRIKISPSYQESRYLDYVKYNLQIIENNKVLETISFTFNPDIIESGSNKSLQSIVSAKSNQINVINFEPIIYKFASKVASISGLTFEECMANDLLFGKNSKGIQLDTVKVDLQNGFNLSYVYGIDLDNGTNGAFGDFPFANTAYTKQLVDFFSGKFTNDIYDVDNYKIDLIVDANYPAEVKREIEKLITFREDATYIRDLGLGLKTEDDILMANQECLKNKFCYTSCLSYDVIDPYTKKQVPVTIGYSLTRLLIKHFKGGRHRPIAGQLYDMTIPEAIPGTINFLPKITPVYNQKRTLCDNRINYASFIDGVLTMETMYTSQEKLTQCSFANNILAIQEVVKALRTRCPKMRYSFIDGEDLDKYKEDAQAILDKYAGNFKQLKLVYLQDESMIQNKVFYAAINVVFRNFVQKEYFKVFILNGGDE